MQVHGNCANTGTSITTTRRIAAPAHAIFLLVRMARVGGSRPLAHEAKGLAVDQHCGHPTWSTRRCAPDTVHLYLAIASQIRNRT